jgi:ABC-type phosphate transport system substrate-binding protein
MKFAKSLLTLAFAFCAFTSMAKAQTVYLSGGGSSALFQELGQSSQSLPGVSCLWTFAKTASGASTYIAWSDKRSTVPSTGTDENGNIFIAWGPGSGTCAAPSGTYPIYLYMSLDSVVGDRLYFINDGTGATGGTLTLTGANVAGAGATGAGEISAYPNDVPSGIVLPSAVITALTTSPANHFNFAGTDIRPEDAQFVIQRAFTPCAEYLARQYFNNDSFYLFGLGYQTSTANIGTPISGSSLGTGTFHVYNFNIFGDDPISGLAVPSYNVLTIGAQPIIIAVSPSNDGQVAEMRDITTFTLSQILQGNLARTNDLVGPTGGEAFNVLVREPLSGTYNTLEFSIPNGTQYHGSQDVNNCTGSGSSSTVSSNPMVIPMVAGVTGTDRYRVIGTSKMLSALSTAPTGTPRLGYFFWSLGNVQNAGSPLTNVKYLQVNGIDPLLNQLSSSYSYNGVLPGSGASGDPGIGAVTFTQLNNGDYPIWSPLRLVVPQSGNGATGGSNWLTALHTLDSSQNDYIPVNSLNVWHSHFFINGQSANITAPSGGATVGGGTTTLCAGGTAEQGGDAGGSNALVLNTVHFCSDFGSTSGKLNLTQ